MTNNMRFAVLTIFVYLLYSCSLNDDFNKDDVVNALYNKHDRRLLDYDAVMDRNKQLIWHEEFDDNDSKWPIDVTIDQRLTVIDGSLMGRSDYLIPFSRSYQMPVMLEQNKNYEIEINVNAGTGQIISLHNPDYAGNNGVIPASQIYILVLKNKGNKHSLALGNGFPQIYSSEKHWLSDRFNRITIRKIGNKYAFFINSNFFYILNKTDFIGKAAMIWMNNNTKIDYVRFWLLNLP